MPAARFPPPPAWADALPTVGVTGTNGKTTTTAWTAAALRAGTSAPVVRATTVGVFLDDALLDVPPTLDGFLTAMRAGLDHGARSAAIELTSESLALGFWAAWPVRVGVFTNLTHDHLDSHGSPEHYLASKAQLFVHLPPGGAAVLNACDPASSLLSEILPEGVRRLFYGAPHRGAPIAPLDLEATSSRVDWTGTHLTLRGAAAAPFGDLPASLTVRAIGHVYTENALASLAAAVAFGVDARTAALAISQAPPPPGRFEVVSERPHVVVDYAHSPDALERAVRTARDLVQGVGAASSSDPPSGLAGPSPAAASPAPSPIASPSLAATPPARAGRVTLVFGAGGDRDRAKRAPMARAASLADRVVLTNDNPRTEDPRAIAAALREGLAGHPAVDTILDRAAAITAAVRDASPDDVVLVAGRGHETEQLFADGPRPFSDVAFVRALTGSLTRR